MSIQRLEKAKFHDLWTIVSKFAIGFSHDFCDEFYMDPIWDLAEMIDLDNQDVEVPTEPFWRAIIEVKKRINSGHPEYGQIKPMIKIEAMHRLSATQDDLKRIIWPGWVPLLERGVVEVC